MSENIAANRDFDNAGANYEQGYFDRATGGFVLIHKGHNRGESFNSGVFIAEVFAKNGSKVKLLDESDAMEGRRPDAEIDGQIWDFKRLTEKLTNLQGAVQRGFTEARKQGADAIAYHIDRDKYSFADINEGIRNAIYYDRSGRIKVVKLIFTDGTIKSLTRGEWDENKRFSVS